ncbi:hypothetical protein OfM1_11300 [Lactovum odontotermitis]
MKFFRTRNLVLTGAVLAVVGAILLIGGFAMGGFKNSIGFEDGRFQVVKNESTTQTRMLSSDIKKLFIDTNALQISIKVGKEFSVKSQLIGRELTVTRPKEGDAAIISTTSDIGIQLFSFGFKNDESLVITVPDKKQLRELRLSLDASNVDVDDLELLELSGKLAASNLSSNNLSVNSINFKDVEASQLNFNGLKLEKGGNIKMEASSLAVRNSQLPKLAAEGEASYLKINGKHIDLPYLLADTLGIPGFLYINMEASGTTIED